MTRQGPHSRLLVPRRGSLTREVSSDEFIQHDPSVADSFDSLRKQSRTVDEGVSIVGQGDLVLIAAGGTHEGKPCTDIGR